MDWIPPTPGIGVGINHNFLRFLSPGLMKSTGCYFLLTILALRVAYDIRIHAFKEYEGEQLIRG